MSMENVMDGQKDKSVDDQIEQLKCALHGYQMKRIEIQNEMNSHEEWTESSVMSHILKSLQTRYYLPGDLRASIDNYCTRVTCRQSTILISLEQFLDVNQELPPNLYTFLQNKVIGKIPFQARIVHRYTKKHCKHKIALRIDFPRWIPSDKIDPKQRKLCFSKLSV